MGRQSQNCLEQSHHHEVYGSYWVTPCLRIVGPLRCRIWSTRCTSYCFFPGSHSFPAPFFTVYPPPQLPFPYSYCTQPPSFSRVQFPSPLVPLTHWFILFPILYYIQSLLLYRWPVLHLDLIQLLHLPLSHLELIPDLHLPLSPLELIPLLHLPLSNLELIPLLHLPLSPLELIPVLHLPLFHLPQLLAHSNLPLLLHPCRLPLHLFQSLQLPQASSMLRMSLASSALAMRTLTLPRLRPGTLLVSPVAVTSMLMLMEFSKLLTTLLILSMVSKLLVPTSLLPLLLPMLPFLLVLQFQLLPL